MRTWSHGGPGLPGRGRRGGIRVMMRPNESESDRSDQLTPGVPGRPGDRQLSPDSDPESAALVGSSLRVSGSRRRPPRRGRRPPVPPSPRLSPPPSPGPPGAGVGLRIRVSDGLTEIHAPVLRRRGALSESESNDAVGVLATDAMVWQRWPWRPRCAGLVLECEREREGERDESERRARDEVVFEYTPRPRPLSPSFRPELSTTALCLRHAAVSLYTERERLGEWNQSLNRWGLGAPWRTCA
jgi:hypothetical protein